jgi:hypothetical protein
MTKKEKDKIIASLKDELNEMLSDHNAEGCIKKIIELDSKNQTITIMFQYYVVPEDKYVGFACY